MFGGNREQENQKILYFVEWWCNLKERQFLCNNSLLYGKKVMKDGKEKGEQHAEKSEAVETEELDQQLLIADDSQEK